MRGFVFLLPLLLTFFILQFLVDLLTDPFLTPIRYFFSSPEEFQNTYLLWNSLVFDLFIKIFVLALLFGGIVLIGLLGKLFLVRLFILIADHSLYRIPFVNKIYQTLQEIVKTSFSSKTAFTGVVFAPFPTRSQLSMGLIGQLQPVDSTTENPDEVISVFIPETPNPTFGLMLRFKKEDLIFTDIKPEEGMKFIISWGTAP